MIMFSQQLLIDALEYFCDLAVCWWWHRKRGHVMRQVDGTYHCFKCGRKWMV